MSLYEISSFKILAHEYSMQYSPCLHTAKCGCGVHGSFAAIRVHYRNITLCAGSRLSNTFLQEMAVEAFLISVLIAAVRKKTLTI